MSWLTMNPGSGLCIVEALLPKKLLSPAAGGKVTPVSGLRLQIPDSSR